MARAWIRVAGVIALVATMGAGAAAFRIDSDVVTDVVTPASGLWVPAPATGDIVHVDAASSSVTARVRVADAGSTLDVAERGASVVVLDRTAGRAVLVDPALHEVVRQVGGLPVSDTGFDIGPEAIVTADRDRVAVVDLQVTAAEVHEIDAPIRSVAADGRGAVVDNGLERFAIDAAGAVAAGATSRGHVVRVVDRIVALRGDQVTDLTGREIGCFENNLSGPDVAVGTAERWVVAVDGTNVHVADLTDGDCAVVRLGDGAGPLGRPVVADRRVFVPETSTGSVYVIDPARREAQRHANVVAPGHLRLRARADMVVAYDIRSPFAALLGREGVLGVVDTSVGEQATTELVDGDGDSSMVVGDGNDGDVPVVAVPGVDSAEVADDAPVLDANVLTATVEDQRDEEPAALPDDDLVANFSFSATTVTVGEFARFVDSSTGNPDSWRWDFGDGTGGEGPEVRKAWDVPGTYPVTLTVGRGEEESRISLGITVVPKEVVLPPAADFAFSSTVVQVGERLEFEDRSDGEIERWRWDFGDGTTAMTPDASHAWSAPGRYRVQLTVANEQGSDRASIFVEVLERLRAPVAAITASATTVDLGEPVAFTATSTTDPATYQWNFGDGRTSRGPNPIHVFLETGTFSVTVTAENAAGRSTARVDITVEAPTVRPVAVIGPLPAVIEVGDVVALSSLSTNSPDTETWSFGDGTTASGSEVTHRWTEPGSYLLALTAANAAGSDRVTRTVVVVAELPAPIAVIGDYDESPWVNETTVFIDASRDATAWLWDFGDGTTSTSVNPLHTFTSPGRKTVTLTVSNRNGSDSTSVIVEPRLEPIAYFEATPRAIRAGQSVSFVDLSDNAASWSWSFGDGTTSSSRNPVHTYATPGTYGVTLTIDNGAGDRSTHGPVTISVDPAPPALESVTLSAGEDGKITTLEKVGFTAVVAADSGAVDGYQIDFDDGTGLFGASGPTFTHAFATAGDYTVRMRAHGPLDEWSEWVPVEVTVADPPPPQVAIADFADPQQIGTSTFSGVDVDGGPIAAWRWEIRRGSSLVGQYTGKTISHTFTAEGDHTITLIAESPVPSVPDHVVDKRLHIDPPPPPSIDELGATPDPATTGVVVQFPTEVTGAVETWEWNYGSGWETGNATGQHIFNTAGTKTVRLRITDAYGQRVEDRVDVVVNPGPAITPITVSPSSTVTTGTTVTLASSDPVGLPGLRWDWRIYRTGEAPPATPTYVNAGDTVTHPFTSAGSWTVSVTATDPNGVSDQEITFVTVEEPLVAGFAWSQTGPLEISFTDASTGPVDAWQWDFDGGTGDTAAPNPVVTYPAPGTYTVTLVVRADGRSSSPTSQVVTVS